MKVIALLLMVSLLPSHEAKASILDSFCVRTVLEAMGLTFYAEPPKITYSEPQLLAESPDGKLRLFFRWGENTQGNYVYRDYSRNELAASQAKATQVEMVQTRTDDELGRNRTDKIAPRFIEKVPYELQIVDVASGKITKREQKIETIDADLKRFVTLKATIEGPEHYNVQFEGTKLP